jgi:DNA-binding NarL/FixJ family response regulator
MSGITNLLPAVPSGSGNTSSDAAAPQNQPVQDQPVQTQTSGDASAYTVQLSEAQQVYQLYNQGLPVTQIASSLSLSVDAVNGYLNLSNSTG